MYVPVGLLSQAKIHTGRTLYSGDGKLLTSTEDIVAKRKEYFEDLL